MRTERERLSDILDAITSIEKYAVEGRQRFDDDELVRVWMLRHLEIIGEASARISQKFRAAHPEIPWKGITGMRNVLVHGYFEIDWDEVWNTVERDIAPLKEAIQTLLRSEGA